MHGWSVWGPASLGVSSSVAEGVLTPAALHLRVGAEVERQTERGGGAPCPRLHFRRPSSCSCRFNTRRDDDDDDGVKLQL